MTVDEVISYNVRRLVEEKVLSVSDLASRMGLGRHVVYDFMRPRKGKSQRPFLWEEIVVLCGALDVTVFELVLPAEGQNVALFIPQPWADTEPMTVGLLDTDTSDTLPSDDRSLMAWILFGMDGPTVGPEVLKKFARRIDEDNTRREAIVREIAEEVARQIDTSKIDAFLGAGVWIKAGEEE